MTMRQDRALGWQAAALLGLLTSTFSTLAVTLGAARVGRDIAVDWMMVGTVLLPYNLFLDKKAAAGTQYFYSVTSIDGQNPANESARSPEVVVGD